MGPIQRVLLTLPEPSGSYILKSFRSLNALLLALPTCIHGERGHLNLEVGCVHCDEILLMRIRHRNLHNLVLAAHTHHAPQQQTAWTAQ